MRRAAGMSGRHGRVAALVAICAGGVVSAVVPGVSATAGQPAATTVQVWLRPKLHDAISYATAVSTPGSPLFHRYLSPTAYTERFGGGVQQASAVTSWLAAHGMRDIRVSAGRDYVSATGSAFASAVRGTAPLPASIASDVVGMTDSSTSPDPAVMTSVQRNTPSHCSAYWAQHLHAISPSYKGLTRAPLPICGYSAKQLRSAYGASWKNTGEGQTVALTEDGAPVAMLQTLRDYAKRNHLPAPGAGQFRLVHSAPIHCTSSSRDALQYDDEAQMDSEAVYAMAPRAKQVMVIGSGCSETQALLDADHTVLEGTSSRASAKHPLATLVSNSWQLPIGSVSPATVDAIDSRAAAEGVGMYFSSGDTSGLTATASGRLVTAVGGTTLGLGRGGTRDFETGWSDYSAFRDGNAWRYGGIGGAAGGGVSHHYRQPAYQKGVVPTSMARVRIGKQLVLGRTAPDLAADADLDTGMRTGYIASAGKNGPGPYRTKVNAGTSLACPLVVGLIADAQQGRRHSFGFINPLIYRLSGTSAFRDVLPLGTQTPMRDRGAYVPGSGISSAEVDVFDFEGRGTTQVTSKGYDTMTGLGTPNGSDFVTALRRAAGR